MANGEHIWDLERSSSNKSVLIGAYTTMYVPQRVPRVDILWTSTLRSWFVFSSIIHGLGLALTHFPHVAAFALSAGVQFQATVIQIRKRTRGPACRIPRFQR